MLSALLQNLIDNFSCFSPEYNIIVLLLDKLLGLQYYKQLIKLESTLLLILMIGELTNCVNRFFVSLER